MTARQVQSAGDGFVPPRDFVQRLQQLADSRGQDVALTVVGQNSQAETVETVFSHARLWTLVRALAATLQREVGHGERALLLLDNDQHYVISLFACFAAGVIAVPVFPPESGRPQHVARLAGIAADAQARALLTTSALAPAMAGLMPSLGGARLIEVDRIDEGAAAGWTPFEPHLSDVAFLQYTSGSTAAPKGVMVTHACLMANEAVIREALSITEKDSFAVWSPLFHDMGLIGGLLQPFYSGIACVLCSPEYFTASPVRWLRLIDRHRVTISGGPDFAYRLCIDRIRDTQCEGLDLSSWRVAYTGAEPIRPDTMTAFVERFGRFGFSAGTVYPCYGLAEATLLVTGVQAGSGMHTEAFSQPALAQRQARADADGVMLVDCGRPASGHAVRIADPQTLGALPPGHVGEIWACGPSIAAGYWQNAAASAATFVTDETGRRWLRTGDLGFLHGEQLYIAGRLKDMIIVRGHNFYPQDIEQPIEDRLDTVRKGRVAAFAVEHGAREGVGVAAEISRGVQRRFTPEALAERIASVASVHLGEAPRVIALLNPGGLPKTSSGKLQRQRCRQLWQENTLDAWAIFEDGVCVSARAEGASRTEDIVLRAEDASPVERNAGAEADAIPLQGVAAELASLWREALDTTAPLTLRSHFFMLGGQSLSAVALASRIAERFRVAFRPHQVFVFPRLDEMAACITALQQDGVGDAATVAGSVAPFGPLPADARHQPQPLSAAQMRQWFLWQLDPSSTSYVIQGALDVRGALDENVLRRAVDLLVQRHDALRTRFEVSADGQVHQRVLPALPPQWLDADTTVQADGTVALAGRGERMRALTAQPFDLLAGPLARFGLLRHDVQHHTLLLAMHHIVADAASIQVLLDDLGALYAALRAGGADMPPVPALQYVDYAVWQQAHPGQTFSGADVAWWKEKLGSQHPVLTLSAEGQRAGAAQRPAGQVDMSVPPALFAGVRTRAERLGTTPFVLMLTAWQLLLSRYSGQACVRVGVPAANRDIPALDRMVGCFVNTLVLPLQVDDHAPLTSLLEQASTLHREAQAHAGVPFDHLVDVLHPERIPGVNPLFQVAFNYLQENYDGFARHTGLAVQPIPPEVREAQFELTLEVRQTGTDEASLRFIHDAQVLSSAMADRMASHYLHVLALLATEDARRVGDVDVLGTAQGAMLANWEQGAAQADMPASVLGVFGPQVRQDPHATALLFEGQQMSRIELDRRSSAVARALMVRGVRPEDRVGIFQERSLDLVVSMLGILKAGGAFVPLDPELPAQRIAYMMQDSGLQVVLTHARLEAQLPAVGGVQALLLDTDSLFGGALHTAAATTTTTATAATAAVAAGAAGAAGAGAAGAAGAGVAEGRIAPVAQSAASADGVSPEFPTIHGSQLAYVIYTSGSTGMPKGVAVNHRALASCMQWMQRVYGLGSDDTVLHKAPIGFDVSCWEIFWPLTSGVRLAIAAPGDHRDPQRIFELIERHRVTTMNFVPQMLQAFLASRRGQPTGLKHVMVGGEAISAKVQSEAVQGLGEGVLQNLYGPTETTIHVTRWTCRDDGRTPVPIGRPIDETQAYVLDAALNRVPVGVAGELYIGGELLARGYMNRPDLTAERFIANPFVVDTADAQEPAGAMGSRLYRTGDLVRWNEEGQLEYLGRADEQVKVRGFRVELGEIEAQLLKQPSVREAVVVARETPQGTQLAGYVSGAAGLEGAALREALKAVLPGHMVPAAIMVLDALPLNANGKIDRRALPAPVLAAASTYQAPQGELETRLARIWSDVLGISQPDRQTNFFDMGGHSLLLATLHQRIQEALSVRIALVDLFQFPTIQAQAARLRALQAEGEAAPDHQAQDGRAERRKQAMLRRKRG